MKYTVYSTYYTIEDNICINGKAKLSIKNSNDTTQLNSQEL